MKFFVHEVYNNSTLEQLLKDIHIPKKEMHFLRMSKDITINNHNATLRDIVYTNDCVNLGDFNEKSNYLPSYRMCDVLYEDKYLAILFKSRGVKTHPNDLHETNTLMNHAIYTLESSYLEPIHRLDQETQGVILVSKHPLVKKSLDYMLSERKITRTYIARVDTKKRLEPQTLSYPIAKDSTKRNQYKVDFSKGKEAITHILSSKVTHDYCEIQLELQTGRTHQIRVHLAHIGMPVIGDTLYGGSVLRDLQLFSYRIKFTHPITKQTIDVHLDEHQF